ncbi:MAG: polysaccharide lyase 6 family protein [Chthoniobacteraceae bacterium]
MTSFLLTNTLRLLVLLPVVALAAEHRVATPAEIAAAAKVAAPGDTVVMKDGLWIDVKIIFETSGTEAQPITLRAETPGKVVITGNSIMRIAGKHLVVDGLSFERCTGKEDVFEFRAHSKRHAYHSRLTNSAFIDCNPTDPKTETRWVSLYGTDNRVDHCYISGKTNRGTTLVVWLETDAVRHRIDHNHFGPRPRLKVNGGETIRIGDSRTAEVNARCVVEANLFEECNGEVEIVSNKSSENIYRGNTFRRCEGALTLRHGHACIVEGNVFLGEGLPRTGGVRVIDADHRVTGNFFINLGGEETRAALCMMNGIVNSKPNGYYPVRRARIEANTFINCRTTFVLGFADEGGTLAPEDCVFADNVVASKHAPHVQTITPLVRDKWERNTMSEAPEKTPMPPALPQDIGPAWKQPGAR